MRKFITILILAAIGFALIALSSIKESLYCSRDFDICTMKSIIPVANITINEDKFPVSNYKIARCESRVQPARGGGKSNYYVLTFYKKDNTDYTIGSYKKLEMCKNDLNSFEQFQKKKTNEITYDSGLGFTNFMGFSFGLLMFFIIIIILTTKPDTSYEDWDDEEEEDETNSQESTTQDSSPQNK